MQTAQRRMEDERLAGISLHSCVPVAQQVLRFGHLVGFRFDAGEIGRQLFCQLRFVVRQNGFKAGDVVVALGFDHFLDAVGPVGRVPA